ncbi:MAG: competence/damage-inducible protein A [Bacteroidota bacterium]
MDLINAEILTIGDEILYGQITDTNSQWMSGELDKVGIKVVRKTTVGDIEEDIMTAFEEAESRADIVLITGGLGPTNDDLTKPCLAKYFDCEIAIHDGALQEITDLFNRIGRELTPLNRMQAALPVCCDMISNKSGTAPGMWFQRNGKVFVSMPGVPYEMKEMMTNTIIPRLQTVFKTPVIYHKIVKTVGIGESWLADKIKDWEDALPEHIKLAYLPSLGQVRLRLTAKGDDEEQLKIEVDELIADLMKYAKKYVFGYGNDKLEEVVGRLLRDRSLTISTAESCTGGNIAQMITSIAGSSDYFLGSVVAYHNDIKKLALGVKEETLMHHGAVSEETIREMAEGVRNRFGTDIGVATSGIAGPGGGTPDKPVGTVWIAYADGNETVAKKLQLWKDRTLNIRSSSVATLNLVRQRLTEND